MKRFMEWQAAERPSSSDRSHPCGDRLLFEPGEEHWHGAALTRLGVPVHLRASAVTRSQYGQQRMGPLWSPVVATGGNRSQIASAAKPREQAKTVATGCHRLPEKFHGKEGVSGSSPEEGFPHGCNGVESPERPELGTACAASVQHYGATGDCVLRKITRFLLKPLYCVTATW
jgi:hypothetical protein